MLRIAKHRFRTFGRLARDASAATAVEYSLIAALMSMAGIVAFIALGDTLTELWQGLDADIGSNN